MNHATTKDPITRREFLKVASLLSLGAIAPTISLKPLTSSPDNRAKNVLIVIYDALSAHNVPLYGYGRDTMPNLSRLAERAVVYHQHIAGGNSTTPGTASILTGTYPWTNRAFLLDDTVDDRFLAQNLFYNFPNHYRVAYTHNPYTQTILRQFSDEIEGLIKPEELFFYNNRFLSTFFEEDDDTAYLAWQRTFGIGQEGPTYSLFLSQILKPMFKKMRRDAVKKYKPQFPLDVPSARGNCFLLEHATDYLSNFLINCPKPFVGYFHFLPPHRPYHTRKDFYGRFKKDGFKPLDKPRHYLSENEPQDKVDTFRVQYDEYLLYVDHEFNRLYQALKKSGVLDDTWLIFTSDHGEMFERGTLEHTTVTMYQPVIHVPMLVFEPGRRQREDIFAPTSSVDLLPTLLHITGGAVPNGCEGVVLPPYSDTDTLSARSLYSMRIKKNRKYAPLRQGSIVMVQDFKKLTYYFGYPELKPFNGELYELFDLEQDPEELHDLASEQKSLSGDMLERLKAKLEEVNRPYRQK